METQSCSLQESAGCACAGSAHSQQQRCRVLTAVQGWIGGVSKRTLSGGADRAAFPHRQLGLNALDRGHRLAALRGWRWRLSLRDNLHSRIRLAWGRKSLQGYSLTLSCYIQPAGKLRGAPRLRCAQQSPAAQQTPRQAPSLRHAYRVRRRRSHSAEASKFCKDADQPLRAGSKQLQASRTSRAYGP